MGWRSLPAPRVNAAEQLFGVFEDDERKEVVSAMEGILVLDRELFEYASNMRRHRAETDRLLVSGTELLSRPPRNEIFIEGETKRSKT